MTQPSVVTHRYTVLQERETTQFYRREKQLDRSLIDWHLSTLLRLYEYKEKHPPPFFYGHNILTEGAFVIQLSSNAGISI